LKTKFSSPCSPLHIYCATTSDPLAGDRVPLPNFYTDTTASTKYKFAFMLCHVMLRYRQGSHRWSCLVKVKERSSVEKQEETHSLYESRHLVSIQFALRSGKPG